MLVDIKSLNTLRWVQEEQKVLIIFDFTILLSFFQMMIRGKHHPIATLECKVKNYCCLSLSLSLSLPEVIIIAFGDHTFCFLREEERATVGYFFMTHIMIRLMFILLIICRSSSSSSSSTVRSSFCEESSREKRAWLMWLIYSTFCGVLISF